MSSSCFFFHSLCKLIIDLVFLHQEQWKNSGKTTSNNWKEKSYGKQDEKGGDGEHNRRKGGKISRKDKKGKSHYKKKEAGMENEPEKVDNDTNMNDHEGRAKNAQDHLRAAGLEDSDSEDDMVREFQLNGGAKISSLWFPLDHIDLVFT